MANEQNLVSWTEGVSGNPGGRPKGKKNRSTIARQVLSMLRAIPDDMIERLKEIYPELTEGLTVEQIMTLSIAEKAISKGDTYAYDSLMNSAYGKVGQAEEEEKLPDNTIDLSKLTIDEIGALRDIIRKSRG